MFQRIAIVNRGEAAMRLIHAVRDVNAQAGRGGDRGEVRERDAKCGSYPSHPRAHVAASVEDRPIAASRGGIEMATGRLEPDDLLDTLAGRWHAGASFRRRGFKRR